MDFDVIHKLFEGVHGAFVNTDSFTVGAAAELDAAFNIVSSVPYLPNVVFIYNSPFSYPITVGNRSAIQSSTFRLVKS